MKKSFRDPATHILKAWGFVDTNMSGDISRSEPLNFNLNPGDWRLVNDEWQSVPQTPAPGGQDVGRESPEAS
ncbi:hypothetical protein [Janthinobacterium fluminis]|uniref:Uncharacterized protein n=1 Tax=Janthinobacterium fluminis TaxID=2987524 RepID=A0ABT5JXP6_9BURK|nr:hypothetical protein [Janthinobacterium fluminis]MDC8757503.1 hypothetical protein [Janthinobacterium fluminis]